MTFDRSKIVYWIKRAEWNRPVDAEIIPVAVLHTQQLPPNTMQPLHNWQKASIKNCRGLKIYKAERSHEKSGEILPSWLLR